MRVRHLQTYLSEHHMLRKSSIDNLRNVTLGIDALHFLRNINAYKDIWSNAAEYISPRFCRYIDEQCAKFESYNISLIFVFEGMTVKAHRLFSSQFQQHIDQGWNHYVNGDKKWALKSFSQVSNPCDSDLVYFLFHYLKNKGVKCIYSPYLATAQLVYFYEKGMIDLILGPPAILLFDLHIVIVNFVWKKNLIEWLYLPRLLKTWHINEEQFLEACLMAGTEYCLTFPYLNLPQFNGGNTQFNFGTAIEFIKQAPLVSYLNHFPNEQVRDNHIEGYCICKSLIKFPVVMLVNGHVSFYRRNGVEDDEDDNSSKKNMSNETTEKKFEHNALDKENNDKGTKTEKEIETGKETGKEKGKEKGKETGKRQTKESEKENYRAWNDINDSYEKDFENATLSEEDAQQKEAKEKRNNSDANEEKETSKIKSAENSKKNGSGNSCIESSKYVKGEKEDTGTEDVTKMSKKNTSKDGSVASTANKEEGAVKKKKNTYEDKETDASKNTFYGNIKREMLIPADYVNVVGAKFPTRAYYLMAEGLLSKKLLTVIALGEWIENSQPLIDSYEYRDALIDLREYRCKILGLIAIKLNPYFHYRRIKFWDTEYKVSSIYDKSNKFVLLDIELEDGLLWKVNKKNVEEEMEKQNIKKVDLQFVLKWHIQREREKIPLICKYEEFDEITSSKNLKKCGENTVSTDTSNGTDIKCNGKGNGKGNVGKKENNEERAREGIDQCDKIKKYNDYYKSILSMQNQNFNSFLALVYFMFLEKLGIFTKSGGVTLFGVLLSESKAKKMDHTVLIIFELLKFGFLATQPLMPANGKCYPKNAYTSVMNNKMLSSQDKKSVLLISRIYSLYDVKLDNKNNYEGLIDFDLCAFFSVVKIIKKTLRQLLQACISNLLLTNMELIDVLPRCLFTLNDDHIYGFFSTNYIMGVLAKYFLLFSFGDVKNTKKGANLTVIANTGCEESSNEKKDEKLNAQSDKNVFSSDVDEKGEKKLDGNQKKKEFSNSSENDDGDKEDKEEEIEKNDKYKEGNGKYSDNCDIHDSNEKNAVKNLGKKNQEPNNDNSNSNNGNNNNASDLHMAEDSQCDVSNSFEDFEKAIKKNFPSVIDPIESLCESIHLWRMHLSLIEKLEDHTNVYNMVSDLKEANKFLEKKIRYVGLHKTKTYMDICESC